MADGVTVVPDHSVTGRKESTVGNPHTFTGREYDAETGLLQYRTRYLHTGLGRFTTRDSMGAWYTALSFGNALAYVASNPLFWVDLFGWDTVNIRPPLDIQRERNRNRDPITGEPRPYRQGEPGDHKEPAYLFKTMLMITLFQRSLCRMRSTPCEN